MGAGGIFTCGISSGRESLEVALLFPARGLALGQGVAKRGARGWARVQGPEDASVGAPLPSTGRRGRSCSAVASRLRARARAPHAEPALGVPRSGVPFLARRHCIWGQGSRLPPAPTHLLPALAAAQSCRRDAQGTPLKTSGVARCRN